jgi:hypothetical protein
VIGIAIAAATAPEKSTDSAGKLGSHLRVLVDEVGALERILLEIE